MAHRGLLVRSAFRSGHVPADALRGRPAMPTARLWKLTGAAGVAISLSAALTGTAVGSTQPTTAPSFAKLSPSQATALSAGKQEPMVVVFSDQLTSLPADRTHDS